jgi:hypothetical protein
MAAGERGSGPEAWGVDSVFSVNGVRWTDVPRGHWARNAIDYVGASNDWMLDFKATEDGTYTFRPKRLESRQLFARAIFRAFGEGLQEDPNLEFPDLASKDRFFRSANVAVSSGWMEVDGTGAFRPSAPVTTREVHRALVLALGLGDLAAGAEALHLRDGTPIETPEGFGSLLIGMRLGLRYNHGDETLDVGPDSALPRAEVAWSLYRATTAPSWVRDSLAPYATMELPNLGPKLQRVVSFAVDYVGYPYVWGGEWHEPSPSGYCCGYQPVGGFDCSGVTWWVMKESVEGWDNTPPLRGMGAAATHVGDDGLRRQEDRVQGPAGRRPDVLRRGRQRKDRPREHLRRQRVVDRLGEQQRRRDLHLREGNLVPGPLQARPPHHGVLSEIRPRSRARPRALPVRHR